MTLAGIAKKTLRRIGSGLTYALGVAFALYFAYLGLAATISEARDRNWGWMLLDFGTAVFFGGALIVVATRFVRRKAKPS